MVLFFRVVTITILIAYAIYMYRDIIKHKEKDSFFHMILYGICLLYTSTAKEMVRSGALDAV